MNGKGVAGLARRVLQMGLVAEDAGQVGAFKNIRGRMIFVGRFASHVKAGMAASSAYPDSRFRSRSTNHCRAHSFSSSRIRNSSGRRRLRGRESTRSSWLAHRREPQADGVNEHDPLYVERGE